MSLSVAVLSRASYVSLHGIALHGRPLSWFRKVHAAVHSGDNPPLYGLRALPPALALADLYGDPKVWHPDVDDLDIPLDQIGAVLSAGVRLSIDLPAPLQQKLEHDASKRAM